MSAARFPSYVTNVSIGLPTTSQQSRPASMDQGDARVQTVHQLSVLALLLHEPQLERDHDVYESRHQRTFVGLDHLLVDLSMAK